MFTFRFSELPENSDRQHHYHQCHHLHCGLPASTTGISDTCFFVLVPLPPVYSLVSICMGYTHINILCHHLFSLAYLDSCHGGNRPSRRDLLLCGTFMFLLGGPTPFPGQMRYPSSFWPVQGVSCQFDITGKTSKSSFPRDMLLRFLRPPQLAPNTTKVHWLYNFLVSFHPSLLFHQYCLPSETDVYCIVILPKTLRNFRVNLGHTQSISTDEFLSKIQISPIWV